MAQYQKKPVIIDAFQLGVDHPAGWFGDAVFSGSIIPDEQSEGLVIHTLEGDMVATRGDFIIKGLQNELYPCKAEIFAASYSPVENS